MSSAYKRPVSVSAKPGMAMDPSVRPAAPCARVRDASRAGPFGSTACPATSGGSTLDSTAGSEAGDFEDADGDAVAMSLTPRHSWLSRVRRGFDPRPGQIWTFLFSRFRFERLSRVVDVGQAGAWRHSVHSLRSGRMVPRLERWSRTSETRPAPPLSPLLATRTFVSTARARTDRADQNDSVRWQNWFRAGTTIILCPWA